MRSACGEGRGRGERAGERERCGVAGECTRWESARADAQHRLNVAIQGGFVLFYITGDCTAGGQ